MKTEYIPRAGCHIETACKEAVALATSSGKPVRFSFNEIELEAKPDLAPSGLVAEFHAKLDAEAEEYRNSPAGIKAKQEQTRRALDAMRNVQDALAILDSVIGDQLKLMIWLRSFTEHADHIEAKFSTQSLADRLESAGYMENEGVGYPPEWFNTRDRMARYIIGQAINCLRSGMPPHPVTASFVDKYLALK